LIEALLQ